MKTPLPPDTEEMNETRALWAHRCLAVIGEETGCDAENALQDLLCNLMHLCDRTEGMDFADALEQARRHYAEETAAEVPAEDTAYDAGQAIVTRWKNGRITARCERGSITVQSPFELPMGAPRHRYAAAALVEKFIKEDEKRGIPRKANRWARPLQTGMIDCNTYAHTYEPS
jgi:hypothetical protein